MKFIIRYIEILLLIAGIVILPLNALGISRTIHTEWDYLYKSNVAGYRLYLDNTFACETTDPSATSMDCQVDAPDGESLFTLTTFLADGTESSHSEPYSYIFSSNLKAVISADSLAGESPLPITFDATSSTGDIISFDWSFGDGETGSGDIVNHTFTAAGNYTVTLITTDDTGAYDQEVVYIAVTSPTVTNSPPTAAISSSSSVGDAPLEVQFIGSGSFDSDGTIISYKWDMGDGGVATGPEITYTYSTAGSFNATLTVTDDGGLTDIISTPVIVSEPPAGVNTLPVAVISASTSKGYKPLTVSFNAEKSNDSDGTITAYSWNFGDGASATGISVNHTFSQDAVYTITLKVTDNLGASSQVSRYILTVLDADKPQAPLPVKTLMSLQTVYNLLLGPSPENEPPEQTE